MPRRSRPTCSRNRANCNGKSCEESRKSVSGSFGGYEGFKQSESSPEMKSYFAKCLIDGAKGLKGLFGF